MKVTDSRTQILSGSLPTTTWGVKVIGWEIIKFFEQVSINLKTHLIQHSASSRQSPC